MPQQRGASTHLVVGERHGILNANTRHLAKALLYGQHVHGERRGATGGEGWNRNLGGAEGNDGGLCVAGQQQAAAGEGRCASVFDGNDEFKRFLDEN